METIIIPNIVEWEREVIYSQKCKMVWLRHFFISQHFKNGFACLGGVSMWVCVHAWLFGRGVACLPLVIFEYNIEVDNYSIVPTIILNIIEFYKMINLSKFPLRIS